MQTSEKKGLTFWKGELENDKMRGVLSRHIDEKTIKDYTFYSTAKEMITEAPPVVATPPAVVTPPAPPAEEVKKEEIAPKTADVETPAPAKEEKKKGR